MARFLVEVPLLTNADWGCKDGEHKAWFIAEVDRRDDARNLVPSPLRSETRVVQLHNFTTAEVEHILNQYSV